MATVKKNRVTQYNQEFHKTVARLARTRKTPFTIDDVVAKVGNPPQGRTALGALMNVAANNLDLQIAGYLPSKVQSRRGALNSAWTTV